MAYIFDMDGTLLDSMGMWRNLCSGYINERGIVPDPDAWSRVEHMTFSDAAFFVAKTYPQLGFTGEQLLAEWEKEVIRQYRDVAIKPGVIDFLERARAKGIHCCVATLTDRYMAEPALISHDMLQYFDFILTVAECGVDKRRPDLFIKCAEKLGDTPQNSIVFEDSPYAAKTAKAAGFCIVGVYDEYNNAGCPDELASACDIVIRSFSELNPGEICTANQNGELY